MTVLAGPRPVSAVSLLLPAALLLLLLGFMAAESGALRPGEPVASVPAPPTVTIAPRAYSYRAAGEFLRDGVAGDGPLIGVAAPPPLEIMTYQVTAADYGRCVAAGACEAAEPRRKGEGDVPVTGVSFEDAEDYAHWLSAATGTTWRLPTIGEWTFAAGSKAIDPVIGVGSGGDPAARWLAEYERESALGARAFAPPEPVGRFGVNEFGVADLAGPVWEWTASCNGRTALDAGGRQLSHIESCGVRFVEGRHRAAMSTFVRDARGGGCSVGALPDNLGFRLVREPSWFQRLFGA